VHDFIAADEHSGAFEATSPLTRAPQP